MYNMPPSSIIRKMQCLAKGDKMNKLHQLDAPNTPATPIIPTAPKAPNLPLTHATPAAQRASRILSAILSLLLAAFLLAGCSGAASNNSSTQANNANNVQNAQNAQSAESTQNTVADPKALPQYSGTPYTEVNGNQPSFSEADKSRGAFEEYSELDSLGRCGVAFARIGTDTMPTEKRGAIGSVKPSGWHTVRYNGVVEGNYLYNRCHLIGYQLAGENANTKNLITGTRYLNTQGMLPFEDKVAEYVKATGNHVLYRVTPIFEGEDLVADGVQMEAWSLEDAGVGVCFNVYCYNVQPGTQINYVTGDSQLTENAEAIASAAGSAGDTSGDAAGGEGAASNTEATQDAPSDGTQGTYVLNTKSMKFHKPECSSVSTIKDVNKQDYSGARQDLIDEGYSPCGECKP